MGELEFGQPPGKPRFSIASHPPPREGGGRLPPTAPAHTGVQSRRRAGTGRAASGRWAPRAWNDSDPFADRRTAARQPGQPARAGPSRLRAAASLARYSVQPAKWASNSALSLAVEHTKFVKLEVLFELGVRRSYSLFTKFRLKRSERGPQPRLDRAERVPRAFRDFALGESFEVSEFHGLALCLRQSS